MAGRDFDTLYIFLVTSFRLAGRELWRHGLRSLLTMVGVLIGVAAVTCIASLGQGLKDFFAMSVGSAAAADLIYVMPDIPISLDMRLTTAKPFKNRDVLFLRQSPYVAEVIGGNFKENALVKHGWRSESLMLANVDRGYFALDRLEAARGRLFNEQELRGAAKVVVVGGEIRDMLYRHGEDVVGSSLTIDGLRFEVIGELGKVSIMEGGIQENRAVYIPLSTGQHRVFGTDDLFWMAIKVRDNRQIIAAKEDIARRLRASRRIRSGKDDDFLLLASEDFAAIFNQYVNQLASVLVVVAILALIVGGVGVMNIMLVSVAERRYEIGLRKAVGATRMEILWQFMVEALALTTVGGMAGLAAGMGLANLIGYILEAYFQVSWSPSVPLAWVAIVYTVALLIGVLCGVYPAWLAARLDPIRALHAD